MSKIYCVHDPDQLRSLLVGEYGSIACGHSFHLNAGFFDYPQNIRIELSLRDIGKMSPEPRTLEEARDYYENSDWKIEEYIDCAPTRTVNLDNLI